MQPLARPFLGGCGRSSTVVTGMGHAGRLSVQVAHLTFHFWMVSLNLEGGRSNVSPVGSGIVNGLDGRTTCTVRGVTGRLWVHHELQNQGKKASQTASGRA